MSRRRLAAVGCAAVAAWAALALPARSQTLPGGSQVPCAAPMVWTVTEVDARFGLSEERAREAAREAGQLWERALGVRLFRFGEGGEPISFEFDQRQADVEEGQERERALEAERAAIEARRAELEEASREHQSDVQAYERDAQEYQWAVRAYNNDMARASRSRNLPDSERRELAKRGEDLERDGRRLQDRVRDLNRRAEEMGDESDRLNQWIEAFSDRQTSHVGAYPEAPTQAGRYDETVFWMDGRVDSVSRRIRIFQYTDYEALVLTLAHELGHALGVGHLTHGGSLMSEVLDDTARTELAAGLTGADVRALSARCPDLTRGDGDTR